MALVPESVSEVEEIKPIRVMHSDRISKRKNTYNNEKSPSIPES